MKRYGLIAILLIFIGSCAEQSPQRRVKKGNLSTELSDDYPRYLSEWAFFKEPLRNLEPRAQVMPYQLASPLFSDYALKKRFVAIPKDSTVLYREEGILAFPEGTVLIKNFHYQKEQIGEDRILETRLLIRENKTWKALSYLWNEAQTEAERSLSGASIPLELSLSDGSIKTFNYSVPNEVQCKSCHEYKSTLSPIGPKASQLNHPILYSEGPQNQLAFWQAQGFLKGWPGTELSPKMVAYHDQKADLNLRARAYLDINCAHCHRAEGAAKNSGLYLTYQEEDSYKLGWYKPPVAAGRGSGGHKFALVPGSPENSILYHRMASLDPGVMMPELGRKLEHQEGLDLIAAWIEASSAQL